MGYAVYEDRDARAFGVDRWAGYGVPAECDWPDCHEHIDRGLDAKCEEHVWYEEPDDADDIEHIDEGCGLYFCGQHQGRTEEHARITRPKPDSLEWQFHMLTHESWQQWRNENPDRVKQLQEDRRLTEIQRIVAEHETDMYSADEYADLLARTQRLSDQVNAVLILCDEADRRVGSLTTWAIREALGTGLEEATS